MQMPLEITFRGISRSEALEALIREKVEKLERHCDYVVSCRVAVEKSQMCRVRVDLRVPPNHELVVDQASKWNEAPLEDTIRQAFEAARRQLQELVDRQHGATKAHPTNESNGVVDKIFRDGGYGFIKSADGREIFFHEHAVVEGGFGRLEVGAGVRFVETSGEQGPQASTVQLLDPARNSPVV